MDDLHGRIEVMSEEMAVVLREMSGAERLRIADEMFASARRMLMSHLRSMHPEWDDAQVAREAATRLSHGAF